MGIKFRRLVIDPQRVAAWKPGFSKCVVYVAASIKLGAAVLVYHTRVNSIDTYVNDTYGSNMFDVYRLDLNQNKQTNKQTRAS